MDNHECNKQLRELTALLGECQNRIVVLSRAINGTPPDDLLEKPATWIMGQIVDGEHEMRAGQYRNALKRVIESFETEERRTMTVLDVTELPIQRYLKFKNFGKKALQAVEIVLAKYGLRLEHKF